MEQIFLYQQWLHQKLHEYVHSYSPPKLRGREIVMSPSHYARLEQIERSVRAVGLIT